ncbi:MAG: MerR family transcriptional regulator [Candidatus Galacturonibacter soehngenii]|nr:MerR family transcriptional regulator [Candidatus Galacturonibacter soehngenii]
MKINQVAKITNLSQKTIRYYEERGLIRPDIKVIRNRNFRDYSKQTVCRLISISTLRKLLFSIDEIKILLEQPSKMHEVLISYENRIREETKQRTLILSTLSSIKANMNIKDIDSLSEAFIDVSQNYRLPLCDIYPDFSHIDPKEPEYNNQRKRRIHTKHSLFAKKANAIELFILELLWKNKSMDFNAIAHRCIERGIFLDSEIAFKTFKRMQRRKLIQYKEGYYTPLVSSSHLEFRNYDSIIQTAYNGSPNKLIYTPPSTPTGFGSGAN